MLGSALRSAGVIENRSVRHNMIPGAPLGQAMGRPYYIVDAFATEPFGGNPAAVVLDADDLDDERMQAIAAEFNLSETTFVLKPTSSPPDPPTPDPFTGSTEVAGDCDAVRFRWFTPAIEVDMCGHATIAGVHALFESGRLRASDPGASATVRIETRSGWLTASVEPIPGSRDARMIWLELVPPTLTTVEEPLDSLAGALGLDLSAFDQSMPTVRTQDGDALVFVNDFATLNDARPDFHRLARIMSETGWRGLSLATVNTLTPSIQVQSRFFAPTCGIDEDPVTGSVHGPLAAYLVSQGRALIHDGLAGLSCVQGIPGGRTGLVHALVREDDRGGYRVRIAGQAVTVMTGTLRF